jgi:hypothetical protein
MLFTLYEITFTSLNPLISSYSLLYYPTPLIETLYYLVKDVPLLLLTSATPLPLTYFQPSSAQVALAFLPEIMLTVMITYLLVVVSIELGRGRHAKVIAIDC